MSAEETRPVLLWDLDGTLVVWRSRWVIPYVAWRHVRFLAGQHGWWAALRHGAPSYLTMLRSHDGRRLNRVYLAELARRLGVDEDEAERRELEFVATGLPRLQEWIEPLAPARDLFERVAASGRFRNVACTNPTMPQRFNHLRLGWAGYDPGAFERVTGTETSTCLKGRPRFFEELAADLGVPKERCLVIGNDRKKDLSAALAGFAVFLLENGHQANPGALPGVEPAARGDYVALERFLEEWGAGFEA